MRYLTAVFIAAALVTSTLAQYPLVINTPVGPVVQCVPTEIIWEGGVAPFFLNITDHGPETVESEIFFDLLGQSFIWATDFPARTVVQFSISDGVGETAFSGPVLIRESDDSSCL
ncbi:hypothetical protein OH77DRAFT_1422982 [Trametes cingulata]|nr:hypothetical protein OH77DRAFT_1422982 [Trametes cingulata]